MRKIFTLLFALAASIGTIIASNTFVDGIWYDFNDKLLTAEVTYQGPSYSSFENEYSGALNIPSTVTYNDKTYSVTSIGYNAFYGCSNLTAVTIPNSITNIKNMAFYGCTGLTSVEIPNSVGSIGYSAFYDVPNVAYSGTATGSPWQAKSVNGYIDGYLVYSDDTKVNLSACSSAAGGEITIPYSVTSIGYRAFSGCKGLTSVNVPNCVTSIGNSAFYGVPNVAYSGTATGSPWGARCINGYIDGYLVYSDDTKVNLLACSSEVNGGITIPYGVTTIGESTFDGCTGLTSAEIPNSVISIKKYAFRKCSGLTSIDIPNSVTSIGNGAFSNCTSLTSVTISNSVTSIENGAFGYCCGLTSISVPSSVIKIGGSAFFQVNNIVYFGSATGSPWGAKSVNGYVNGYLVYSDATQATLLGCSSAVTEITIPNSVISIGDNALFNCRGLTSIKIPSSVANIGLDAFLNCDNLEIIECCANIPPILGNNTTLANPQAIYIPCGSMETYITNWTNYASIIQYKSFPYSVQIHFDTLKGFVSNTPMNTICDTILTITATPNDGYHFAKWEDESTDRARVVHLSQDTILTAEFAINIYSINVTSNTEQGVVNGENGQFEHGTKMTYEAVSNYGYHFTKWSDGYTENPRTIVLTQDTTIEALFALNSYTIRYITDSIKGSVQGIEQAEYLDSVTMTAISNYGYHFAQWNDGIADNPRIIELTQDTTIEAIFAKHTYSILYMADSVRGRVQGLSQAEYLDSVKVTASSNYGYHFEQWSDGNADNPRTIVITQDTTMEAEFAPNKYDVWLTCDREEGYVLYSGKCDYLTEKTITAFSYYGYYFTNWADGCTDNPRTVVITQDTTFEAVFAKNMYTIEVTVDSVEWGSVSGTGSFEYLTECELLATPNYGYHFVQWTDSAYYDNPQNITTVAQAYSIASALAKNEVTDSVYTIIGYITGKYGNYTNSYYLSDSPDTPGTFVIFKAENSANIGDYIMVTSKLQNYLGQQPETVQGGKITKLSECIYTANPLTITLKKDISLVAEFAKNIYTLSVQTSDETMGIVSGGGDFEYLSTHTIEASSNYGYRFTGWSDGDMNNPRTIVLASDTTFTATFAKNPVITYIYDHTMGTIVGDTTVASEASGEVTFEAVPYYGYHFTQWSDGNTENPRTIILTQDTTFAAEFAIDKSGTCGANYMLNWTYDDQAKILTISGNGTLDDHYTYGLEAPTQMKELIIGNGISVIGYTAFYGSSRLMKIYLGESIETIGNNAFRQCPYILEIYAPMEFPPVIDASVFAECGDLSGINCYVLEESLALYKKADVWKEFNLLVGSAPQGIDNTSADQHKATKILRDGQIFILRGDHTYTLTGQEVR